MVSDSEVRNFITNLDLDIVSRGPLPRFLDQKVQPDVLQIVSRSIINLDNAKGIWFSRVDLQINEYTNNQVLKYFGKPDTSEKSASNEYDKFFGQILNFLCFYKALERKKKGQSHDYKIINNDILKYISNDTHNALNFIIIANNNFIEQNNLTNSFNLFFKNQTKSSLYDLKDDFRNFLHTKTNITKDYEAGRIFTPLLNPLAFERKKYGTEKGRLSGTQISFTELLYGRTNWRDILEKKPRNVTRQQWLNTIDSETISNDSAEEISKDDLKNKYGDISEYSGEKGAVHTHHIFPKSDYSQLKHYKENLIRITPNEHLIEAHPDGKTQRINKKFQIKLLLAKLNSIRSSIEKKEDFYDISKFIKILNDGYKEQIPDSSSMKDLENFLNSKKHSKN